jgi:hypothetical protein
MPHAEGRAAYRRGNACQRCWGDTSLNGVCRCLRYSSSKVAASLSFDPVKYVFLTACRNEELILEQFWDEFAAMARKAGIADRTVLYVVDDLSTDRSRDILRRISGESAIELRLLEGPTNFGNQGAMFYGLGSLDIAPDDVLVTFDCDGEDDVREIPSILELGASNPEKLILIERGRRAESLAFKVFFAGYKVFFRMLTRQRVVPNNFMLIPGRFVPAIRRSPLAAVHLAYGILRLNPPRVVTIRDRRPRYGGRTSQNLFMLMSHGLVGLMVFYETVIAKLFFFLFALGAFAVGTASLVIAIPASNAPAQRALIWTAVAAILGAAGFMALLLSAALALVFKLAAFTLSDSYAERLEARRHRAEGAPAERSVARGERSEKIGN